MQQGGTPAQMEQRTRQELGWRRQKSQAAGEQPEAKGGDIAALPSGREAATTRGAPEEEGRGTKKKTKRRQDAGAINDSKEESPTTCCS